MTDKLNPGYLLTCLVVGVIGQIAFNAAILLMGYSLYFGLTKPLIPAGNRWFNLFLAVQFPILHSYFLSKPGAKLLGHILPKSIRSDMRTTIYALFASFQIILTFLFWTPSEPFNSPNRTWTLILSGCYLMSWILLFFAIKEAGLSLHNGNLGWLSIIRQKKVQYPSFPEKGLHRRCKHPIYLAFFLILITGPIWSIDHLALASIWGLYCILGPILKQRRQRAYIKEYDLKTAGIPYFLPRFFQKRGEN